METETKQILGEIFAVSKDLRHAIVMEYTEQIDHGQKQLLALLKALEFTTKQNIT